MVLIFSSLILGIILGRSFLRSKKNDFLPRLITFIIWVLLFSLGLEVGSDSMVMSSLGTLGLSALGMSVASILGGVLMSVLLWRFIKRGKDIKKNEVLNENLAVNFQSEIKSTSISFFNRLKALWDSLKGSLIIVTFFLIGILVAYFNFIPNVDFKELSFTKYILYALLLCVGMTIGADSTFFSQIRSLNWRFMLLPVMTALGTFLGVSVLWLFLRDYLLTDYLAVGSGFAYYSLSSIFITEIRGAELGTIALLSNIFREILALLFIPLVAKLVNPLAAISMGGATTFDTTLPIITQSAGKEYVVVSAFHGCLLDFSVPFFVMFFCGLS